MSWKWLLPAALAILVVAGCGPDKKPKDQKEAAARQWRQARATVLYGLAQDQYKNGNFEQARTTTNDALKLAHDSVPLRLLSARLAIEQGQLEVADRELSAARKVDAKNAEVDYLSGVIYQRWQKLETAYEYYHSAAEKQPAELAYIMAKSEMLVAMNREEEALKFLQEKVAYFEHSAVIRDAVGQLLVHKGQYKAAAEMLRQSSILAPDDFTIREHLSLALYLSEQWLSASEQLARLTSNEKYAKRADLWVTLGECQMQLNNPRAARQSFEQATQLDPNMASAWLSFGRAALQSNDFRRADLAARKAVSLEPDNGQAHLLIGYLRLHEGKGNEALAAFRKASALDQQDTVSLCMVGYAMEKTGRASEAVKYYAKALKIKPNDELATKLMASIDLKD
ncbi:MAG TPA: tetratricopeptide repeat protein [Tepidisphaeraceae bacterium]|jgi:tetratricopeptide (TPR) repeat protein